MKVGWRGGGVSHHCPKVQIGGNGGRGWGVGV